MIDKENIRAGLLSSLDDGIALLQKVQSDVRAMNEVNVARSTDLQLELVKQSSAIIELHLRIKSGSDFLEVSPESRLPDYEHWARLSWSVFDAAALAANRDPEEVDWEEPTPLLQWLRSAVQSGNLKEPLSPGAFLQWFDRLGDEKIVLPSKLRQAVVNHEWLNLGSKRPVGDTGSLTGNKQQVGISAGAQTKVIRTLHRLLVYVMTSGTSIDIIESAPPKLRGGEGKKIANNLKPTVDVKTVETHINQALKTVWEMGG